MDKYGFLVNFFGIVLGIATAKSLEGLIYPLKRSRWNDFYLPHLLASGLIILLIIQSWWGLFDDRNVQDLDFGAYLQSLLTPMAYYFMAELLTPDGSDPNIQTHYWRRIRPGMIVATLSMLNNMITQFFISGSDNMEGQNMEEQAVRMFAIVLTVSLAISKREWVHYVGYALFYVAFVVFVAIS